MNKTELIKLLAVNTGFTQDQTRRFVNELMLLAQARLKAGLKFALHDLVEVRVVHRPERSGVAMGHKWHKPAGKELKAKIIGKGKRMFEVAE